jgi:cyanophycinase
VTSGGTVALIGGCLSDELVPLGRSLLETAKTDRVLVLPTAAAYERPDRLVASVAEWFDGPGARAEGLALLARHDASRPECVDALRASRFTYVGGGSPMHLRSVLKDTPAWEAMVSALAAGGVVVGESAGAMVLTDPMVDPRGGAFTLGLGLVPNLAVIPSSDQWSRDRLHRTLELAHGVPVATLPAGSALVRLASGTWEAHGDVAVHLGGVEIELAALA